MAVVWSTGVTELREPPRDRRTGPTGRTQGLTWATIAGYDAGALRDARTPSVSFAFRYTYDRGRNLNGISVFSR